MPRLATWESVVSQKANFSTFTMSNTLPKRITLIIKHIQSGDLLDCPLFATKPPFHPKSSRCSFSECLYTRHFPKQALLDLPEVSCHKGKCTVFAEKPGTFPKGRNAKYSESGLWSRYSTRPRGKVNRFRRKTRHFPRRWKCQVRPEGSVEPVPRPATGESAPKSRKSPALSPGED